MDFTYDATIDDHTIHTYDTLRLDAMTSNDIEILPHHELIDAFTCIQTIETDISTAFQESFTSKDARSRLRSDYRCNRNTTDYFSRMR